MGKKNNETRGENTEIATPGETDRGGKTERDIIFRRYEGLRRNLTFYVKVPKEGQKPEEMGN